MITALPAINIIHKSGYFQANLINLPFILNIINNKRSKSATKKLLSSVDSSRNLIYHLND